MTLTFSNTLGKCQGRGSLDGVVRVCWAASFTFPHILTAVFSLSLCFEWKAKLCHRSSRNSAGSRASEGLIPKSLTLCPGCLGTGFNLLLYRQAGIAASTSLSTQWHMTNDHGVCPSTHCWILNFTDTLGLFKYSLILVQHLRSIWGV